MAAVDKKIQLEIGHVLFVDIVGYSKLHEQGELLEHLKGAGVTGATSKHFDILITNPRRQSGSTRGVAELQPSKRPIFILKWRCPGKSRANFGRRLTGGAKRAQTERIVALGEAFA